VKAETIVELPYDIGNPSSDSRPAAIAPKKNPAPIREYWTERVEPINSGLDAERSLTIACDTIKNKPTHNDPTNFDVQIVNTDGFKDTAPFASVNNDRVHSKADFLPTASSKEPNAGDRIISANAAPADMIDRIEVARSAPIFCTRAGAGENATKATERMIKKEDDWKTANERSEEEDEHFSF
jgi:hypothetical protein